MKTSVLKYAWTDADDLDFEVFYYLAGPMSGYPRFNFDAFDEACKFLRDKNLRICSPHEIDHGETEETRGSLEYEVYMSAGLALLRNCSAIVLLPGWPQSTGACREMSLAIDLGYPSYFLTDNRLVSMNRRPPA